MDQPANDPRISDELLRKLESLFNRGDFQDHYHASDRSPTHDTIVGFQQNENTKSITSNYAASYNDDYLFVDSTAGIVTITLPAAKSRVLTVSRVAGGNNVVLSRSGADTINGGTTLTITTSHTPVRLKQRAGIGYEQV